MAKHGKELSSDLKERVVALHQERHGYKKIARALKLSRNTVAKIIQNFKKNGTVKPASKRSGRPKKITERMARLVTRKVLQDRRKSASKLAQDVSEATGSTVSAQTIRRTLHSSKLHGRQPRRKPLLKKRHKDARLKFAKAHQTKDQTFWDKILWSDETKINIFGSDGEQKVWRRNGEAYAEGCTIPTVKHGGGSVMVWGAMSSQGVSNLHFIDRIMTADTYCKILDEHMLPTLKSLGRGALFQHDNDPKHSARLTSAFLKKKKVKVIEWPSMSPDINPIEHLWGVLKRRVEQRQPSSRSQLKEVISEEWHLITAETCSNLVTSMPRRLDAVLASKGGHTKY